MSQSALEREILYDHDYQAAHKEANAICMTIERRINSWQEFLVEAEKKIFELHEELAGARKKREEIEAARRSVGVVNDVEETGVNLIAERILCKIKGDTQHDRRYGEIGYRLAGYYRHASRGVDSTA